MELEIEGKKTPYTDCNIYLADSRFKFAASALARFHAGLGLNLDQNWLRQGNFLRRRHTRIRSIRTFGVLESSTIFIENNCRTANWPAGVCLLGLHNRQLPYTRRFRLLPSGELDSCLLGRCGLIRFLLDLKKKSISDLWSSSKLMWMLTKYVFKM